MKRKIAIVLSIMLLSTSVIFAAATNGSFAGFPIVNVKINGATLQSDVPGVVLQGRTVLPARAIAESLNAVVLWDAMTMTASIVKPDVNMVFIEDIIENSDGTWNLKNVASSNYDVGKDFSAYIFYTIGPMEKQLYSFRILVKTPSGEVLSVSETQEEVIDNLGLMGGIYLENLTFSKPGNYIFEFQIKYNDKFETVESTYAVVS